ncbi:MAG: CinA family protein, partial [Synergistaceae bacterium]|nr:CinA family protein [Synergistaceae bacterium]
MINNFGAVSSECADAMARGALKLFNADFAV